MSDFETADAILTRYNRAIMDKSAEGLAALYAVDGEHEAPFAGYGAGARLKGREAIRSAYAAAWGATPARVRGIARIAFHAARDGKTFIAEEKIALTNIDTGIDFEASTVLVMEIADGQIAHMRDYMDGMSIARGLGRPPRIEG